METKRTKAKPGGAAAKRFPGIVADAQALGVERTHLYRVLIGNRPSARLMARYKALKAREVAASK